MQTHTCDSTMLGGAMTMAWGGAECRLQCASAPISPGRSSGTPRAPLAGE